MVKFICPVCKNKLVDKGLRNEYECTNCKSKLVISKFFKGLLIGIPIFAVAIFSIIGAIITQHVFHDKENLIKYIISPLIEGLLAGCVSFLLIKIYPNKLTQVKEL
ncbi:hypothetical protein [Clostridium folliculivorans]|uniref:Uncharacterized protein n=1 Tax=Clostridium folliculivorans TaxID=2886038 RepID=A0A9W5Y250_9CLOT|nr:hypothetical protein [Clostridium folliculivorans]GKU25132.1 hypothetical protein CFOLD11_19580 [Clostridium folliculivorans]GKU31230.1 hypothetical protein CFB3_33370 [Clostridium folliculivorans]